jgi:choline dehydrogenase-like flavoprotein
MADEADVLVVGSGASGAMAAARLVDAGRRVLLLDAGDVDERYRGMIPERPYASIRREDPAQHTYGLGIEYEGIDLGKTGPLAQATAPRQYVFRRGAEFLRIVDDGFIAAESLAQGGLAEAWGAVAFPFTTGELRRTGLDPSAISPHYEAVAEQVGISGDRDDLLPWRGALNALQPALPPDPNATAILGRYVRRRDRLIRGGVRLGRPLLAVLSQELGPRKPNPQFGLDFWSNSGGSVFRPSLLIESLRPRPGMHYRPGVFVTRFNESGDTAVEVEATDLGTGARMTFRARHLLLAAGALGTTRIVLRSLGRYDVPVPLVCNEHAYIPSVRLSGIGAAAPERAHALAQLTAMYDPTGDQEHLAQAQVYSFTGLPLVRLVKESPLACKESVRILRMLATSLVILVVQHEDAPSPDKVCVLRKGASPAQDVLEIRYRASPSETKHQRRAEQRFAAVLRTLGCWPIRVVHPGAGSSVHYAGTLPISGEEKPLTITRDGRLRGTRRVYVGDGAGLSYLPAKGLTLTLMANARRVADLLATAGD